jgi:hypothetical protein
MKIPFKIFILTLLTSCSSLTEKDSRAILNGAKWENQDLDFIGFDSTLIYVPIKNEYPTACAYNFELYSDTLRIINKTVNAYNVINFKDSISLLKIKYLAKDSFEISLLNDGAKELFNGFINLKFYNSKTIDRFKYYQERDLVCKNAIDSALADIRLNKYVVCIHPPWPFRNEKEFIELLKNDGITYADLGPPPDVLPIDRNCYRETMDYFINKKFEDGFVRKILLKADTLMVRNSKSRVFDYYECDTEPQIDGHRNGSSEMTVKTSLPVEEDRKEWKTKNNEDMFAVYNPFIDLGFQIDTVGQLSNFYINYFNPQLDWNKQFKKELFELGVREIKASGKWIPGTILGQKVNVKHNVRLQFKRG